MCTGAKACQGIARLPDCGGEAKHLRSAHRGAARQTHCPRDPKCQGEFSLSSRLAEPNAKAGAVLWCPQDLPHRALRGDDPR